MTKDKKYSRYGFVVDIPFIILFIFYLINARFLPEKNRNKTVNDVKIEVEIPGDERSPIIRSYENQDYESFSQKKKEGIKEEIKGRIEGDIPCADISGDPKILISFYDGKESVQPTCDVKIRMTVHPNTFYGKYEEEDKVIEGTLEKTMDLILIPWNNV
ncbi:MAG: hypothetical protein Q4P28_05225 [Tissierellia bacterium]|nr:hypothetical protein [Tissierellia bacterium]